MTAKRVVVVEYGMGNVGSVLNMLRRIGSEPVLTGDPATIRRGSHIVLSGVGAFDRGVRQLDDSELREPLTEALSQGAFAIGLCLGLHLLTERSEEGELPGLGWIPGETVRFRLDPERSGLKVPHMGWNTVEISGRAPIVDRLPPNARFYFVHSYHVVCRDARDVAATTEYGYAFPSIVQRGRVMGTQFHPEKSHRFGMALLERFVGMA